MTTKSLVVERTMPHTPEKILASADHLSYGRRMADEERPAAGGRAQIHLPHPADAALERRGRVRGLGRRTPPAPVLQLERRGRQKTADHRHLDFSLPSRAARGCAWSNRASSRRTTTTTRVRPMAGSAISRRWRKWSRGSPDHEAGVPLSPASGDAALAAGRADPVGAGGGLPGPRGDGKRRSRARSPSCAGTWPARMLDPRPDDRPLHRSPVRRRNRRRPIASRRSSIGASISWSS